VVLQQWIEKPVSALAHESLKLAIVEVQSNFIAADSNSLKHLPLLLTVYFRF
jgi:hypothetical protein